MVPLCRMPPNQVLPLRAPFTSTGTSCTEATDQAGSSASMELRVGTTMGSDRDGECTEEQDLHLKSQETCHRTTFH